MPVVGRQSCRGASWLQPQSKDAPRRVIAQLHLPRAELHNLTFMAACMALERRSPDNRTLSHAHETAASARRRACRRDHGRGPPARAPGLRGEAGGHQSGRSRGDQARAGRARATRRGGARWSASRPRGTNSDLIPEGREGRTQVDCNSTIPTGRLNEPYARLRFDSAQRLRGLNHDPVTGSGTARRTSARRRSHAGPNSSDLSELYRS